MRISDEMIENAHKHCKISLIFMYCAGAVMFVVIVCYTWVGISEVAVYWTVGIYFATGIINFLFIERAKKLLDKKVAQTKYRWDTIESLRNNPQNN